MEFGLEVPQEILKTVAFGSIELGVRFVYDLIPIWSTKLTGPAEEDHRWTFTHVRTITQAGDYNKRLQQAITSGRSQ